MGVLHKHSTPFGFATTGVLIVAVGMVSHWSPALMIIVGLLGVLLLPRVFYGLAAARAVDKEKGTTSTMTGWSRNNMWDATPTENERIEKVARLGPDGLLEPDSLQRLADLEAPRNKD